MINEDFHVSLSIPPTVLIKCYSILQNYINVTEQININMPSRVDAELTCLNIISTSHFLISLE